MANIKELLASMIGKINGKLNAPETAAAPHQQLVTDGDGVAKWEDRTHYTASGFVVPTVELFEIDITNFGTYAGGHAESDSVAGFPVNLSEYITGSPIEGYTQRIVFDGKEYMCDMYSMYVGDLIHFYGNQSLYNASGGSDTGEPFFWAKYLNQDKFIFITTDTEAATHTVESYGFGETTKPLDPKYLPGEVPVIQSAQVGQTIAVKAVDADGKPTEWEAVSAWTGKKWACIGDSLTAVNDYTDKRYHDYIAEQTGITVVNMGSGGTGYKKREDEGTAFYQRISSVPTDADIVTIFGSGNDMSLMTVSDENWAEITPTWNTSQYLRGDNSGNVADYAGHDTWVVSDLISVAAGEVYKITAGIQYSKSVLVFYDSEENFVSQLCSETDDAYIFTDEIVTAPATAAYMRVGNVTTIATFALHKQTSGGGLGEPTDSGTHTICGCINTTIDNLYAVLPTVQLGIITPTPWSGYNPANEENNMALYSAAIVEICRLRGIPCLDLYHCSALRPWDETFRTAAYSNDEDAGVHPDATGHAIITPKIRAFIETLI